MSRRPVHRDVPTCSKCGEKMPVWGKADRGSLEAHGNPKHYGTSRGQLRCPKCGVFVSLKTSRWRRPVELGQVIKRQRKCQGCGLIVRTEERIVGSVEPKPRLKNNPTRRGPEVPIPDDWRAELERGVSPLPDSPRGDISGGDGEPD